MEYRLSQRNIPLNDAYEVIVVGGGPAGCAAAIAAAREGSKTLLIESGGFLGGMATKALVNTWCPFSDGEKVVYKGLAEKIFNAAKKGIPRVRDEDKDWVAIDYERLKRVYDEMVSSAGVDVLFLSSLCAVDMDDSRHVKAIIISNKAGLSAYKAKIYIDCTGDADLCYWAGAECVEGDENGATQPGTMCFMLSNVNTKVFFEKTDSLHPCHPDSPIHTIVESGKYDLIPDRHMVDKMVGPGTFGFNAGHIWGVDYTKPDTITKGMMDGRKIAAQFRQALADTWPEAFGDSFLAATGSVVGVRESRRVIGDYVFTIDDFMARRTFADEIMRNCYYIDIHETPAESEEQRKNGPRMTDERYERYQPGETHGLPYRCLTPKDLDNVLVAGRTVSTDRVTQGSLRVMPCCLCMGEAAGIAAAMAAKSDSLNVHTVDVQALRRRLKEEGAYIL